MRKKGSRRSINSPSSHSCSTNPIWLPPCHDAIWEHRLVLVPSRKEINTYGSPTICQLLGNMLSRSSSPIIPAPPACRWLDGDWMSPLQRAIQISTTAITQIWRLGLGVLWNPQHLAALLNREISLENQRKGFGNKQGRNPKEISWLFVHCLCNGCFCCPCWSQAMQMLFLQTAQAPR